MSSYGNISYNGHDLFADSEDSDDTGDNDGKPPATIYIGPNVDV